MYFDENYRKIETDKLYQNPLLIDSLFSNLAYLEPRYLITARKMVEEEVVDYFLKNNITPNVSEDPSAQVKEIYEKIKSSKNIREAKNLLTDAYLFSFGKGIKEDSIEIDSSSFNDVNNYLLKTIAKKLMLDSTNIKTNKLGYINKIESLIEFIPTSKFENELTDNVKKDSFRLMNALMEVVVPVKINKESNLSYINEANREIICKQNNGWFDIGYKDSNLNEFECSFFVGYIENEVPKTLHIGIRGTEKRAMGFTKYLVNDYPNMDRHYSRIKPFLDEIINQEVSKNNKLNIAISGHSLGAAMTELTMLDNNDIKNNTKDITFSGLAIANPGGVHILHKIMKDIDNCSLKISGERQNFEQEHSPFINSLSYPAFILKKTCCFGFKAISFLSVSAVTLPANILIFLNKERSDNRIHRTFRLLKQTLYDLPLKNFFAESIGLSFLARCNEKISRKISESISNDVLKAVENTTDYFFGKPIEDSRLIVVNHEQDIVSKVGGLTTNQKRRNTIILNAVNNFFEQSTILTKTLGTLYHDNNNYVHEIDNITSYDVACDKVKDVLKLIRNRTVPDFNPTLKPNRNPF